MHMLTAETLAVGFSHPFERPRTSTKSTGTAQIVDGLTSRRVSGQRPRCSLGLPQAGAIICPHSEVRRKSLGTRSSGPRQDAITLEPRWSRVSPGDLPFDASAARGRGHSPKLVSSMRSVNDPMSLRLSAGKDNHVFRAKRAR